MTTHSESTKLLLFSFCSHDDRSMVVSASGLLLFAVASHLLPDCLVTGAATAAAAAA